MTRPLRVLVSPDPVRAQGNPYLGLLVRALTEQGVQVATFDLRAALRRDGDVVHVHWPEAGLAIREPRQAASRVMRVLVSLAVARLRGIPVVWTAHNLRSHERPHPRLERAFWAVFPRLLSGWLSLTRAGVAQVRAALPALAGTPAWVTLHGHYRGAYPPAPSRAEARAAAGVGADDRVLVHVGHIRAYKNAPSLVRAYAASERGSALIVAGSCHPPSLADEIRAAATGVAGVDLRLERVPDQDLVALLALADLVVLPYRETFNSGTALLALTADRPVLLPRSAVYEELQAAVAPGWVRLYDGDLTGAGLDAALAVPSPDPPALGTDFDWPAIAAATIAAYRALTGDAPVAAA